MKAIRFLSVFLVFGVTAAAQAGTVNDVGKTVKKDLEMQSSGRQSVATRPMLKDVADQTYERYLESFTYKIPEKFEREESFSANGSR